MLLYQIASLIDVLTVKPKRHTVNSLLQEKLKAGAHPFFLEQTLRYAAQGGFEWSKDLLKEADEMCRNVAKHHHQVPAVSKQGLNSAVSRIYEPDGQPRKLHEGIIHGAMVEALSYIVNIHWKQTVSSRFLKDWVTVMDRFLQHPQADIAMLDNVVHLHYGLLERLHENEVPEKDPMQAVQRRFFCRKVQESGLKDLTKGLLECWDRKSAFRAYSFLGLILEAGVTPPIVDEAPATTVLRTMTGSTGILGQAAKEFLSDSVNDAAGDFYGGLDHFIRQNTIQLMVEMLKRELPAVSTVHALVKWFKIAKPDILQDLVMYLAFSPQYAIGIDPRTEFLLEDLMGPEAWTALCELSDPKYWSKDLRASGTVKMRSGLNTSTDEYRIFVEKVQAIRFDRHNSKLAELVDRQVHGSGHEPKEAKNACDRVINLLAGDLIHASTHLRLEWMRVKRFVEEFLGAHIPRIDVSIYPKFGESGVACKFRIFFTEFPDDQITGLMDPEGKVEFNNIAVLTPFGRNGLRAAVLESLGAILIPRYLERIPSPLRGGCGGNFTGEVWAARPCIHTLGKVEEEPEPPGISFGNRINPVIAQLMFEWLIGEAADCPFRLYRKVKEKPEGVETEDTYYIGWDNAKQLLLAEKVTLSQVYLRTVRAHTKPVGVKVGKDGKVVVQQVSERAKRNYLRFLGDTGRQLDMSPVRKTYELSGGVRIALTLERTFNQGTFNSLDEVWEMIQDRSLKARARSSFKF